MLPANTFRSGLVLLPLPLGALTLVVTAVQVVVVRLAVEDVVSLHHAAAITRPGKMTAATTIGVTVIVPGARTTGTVR
jgi:hypothetical protein